MRFVYKSVESSWKWRIYTRLQSTQLYNCGFILFGLVIARYIHTHVHLSVLQSPAHTNTHRIKQFRIGINRKRLIFFLESTKLVETRHYRYFFRTSRYRKFFLERLGIESFFFWTRRYLFQNTSLSKVHIDNKTRRKKKSRCRQ